ncbi:MAG TPA: hypothetical protein DHV62_07885 [Elusimicrobia bacterium]|nr:hypothetical protein [Elusimicrobiota bacterium]
MDKKYLMKIVQELSANIPKFYIASFFEALWFPLPVWILFFLANGLNLEQIGILIGVLFLTQFIFEIPSSIWADKHSRKRILIIGALFSFFSLLIFFLGNSFLSFLLAVFFTGLANSFRSGTDSALVYDTLLNLNRERDYNKIQSNINGIYFLGRAVVAVIGPLAYIADRKLPFLLAAISSLIAISILFLIKEPEYHKSSGAHLGQIKEGLKFLSSNERIWLAVLVFSLMSAASDVLFTNYQPVLNLVGLPVVYFTIVYLGVNIASFIGSMSYAGLAEKLSFNKILAFYLLVAFAVSLAFASGNLFLILPFILLLSFSFGSHNAYITSLINKIAPSSHRATTISIQSLINMIMLAILIVSVGKIATDYSIFWGMVFNAAITSVALIGFLFVKFNTSIKNGFEKT